NNTGWEDYWQKKSSGPVGNGGFDAPFTHVEERISYFREDVGLNDFLAQMSLFYPTWLDPKKYQEGIYFKRGELFYYTMQQISARYSLERIYNGMPKTDMLYWDQPIKVGYNPKVTSPGGEVLYPRAFNMVPRVFNPAGVWKAEIIERRMIDDLDFGIIFWVEYVSGPMGYSLTAARDPAFYMFLNRLMYIFKHHKDAMPAYTKNDLHFPGVKIESVEVSKLITYFDHFDIDATYGLPIPADKSYKDYHYFGMQSRLNHKPFTYKLTVSSDHPTDAIVRIFIGPKFDSEDHPLTLDEAREAYVELDRFAVKLTKGETVIERNSKESTAFTEDKEGIRSMYTRVKNSIETKETFYVTDSYTCGMPERLMIPKGSHDGRHFMMYMMVTPFEHKRQFESPIYCGGSQYYDGLPYGFPFDRRVEYEDVFNVPNFHREDVLVYHKYESEINKS
ncbi:hypothetical protein AAG570_002557, partial [Ranatra chinensis]